MAFTDQMALDVDVLFNTDEYAEEITYNGTTIDAHVERGENRWSLPIAAEQAMVTAQKADVSAPAYDDAVVFDGKTWRVFQDDRVGPVFAEDSLTITFMVITNERASF